MSLEYFTERIKTDAETGCWLWQLTPTHDGYGKAYINKQHIRAHRLSWELHKGPIPSGLMVLHRCDVRHCVNPDHLFLGTARDNSTDMVNKGRSLAGEKNKQAILTEDQVKLIVADTRPSKIIAEIHGISHGVVARIKGAKAWQHLPEVANQPQAVYIPQNQRTHCPEGHPYDEKNTYSHKGKRYCRTCQNIRRAERHKKARQCTSSTP